MKYVIAATVLTFAWITYAITSTVALTSQNNIILLFILFFVIGIFITLLSIREKLDENSEDCKKQNSEHQDENRLI